MNIEQEIKQFLVNTLKVGSAVEQVDSNAPLVNGYGVDSAGIFEMILWLEDRFGVHVSPADMDLANFETVRAVAAFVARRKAEPVADQGAEA